MKRMRYLAPLVLFLSLSTGCMFKSDHLKVVKTLNTKISGLQKDKSGLQGELKERTDQLASMTKKKNDLESTKSELESQLASLKKMRAQCLSDLKTISSKGGKLSKRLSSALDQIQRLQALADKRKALFDRLKASFQSMVAAGKLRVKMVNGMFIVQLAEKILFPSGKSNLKSQGKEAITQVTGILSGMKRRWQIAGHTDSKGSPSVNWYLSVLRAQAVLKVMLKAGMPPEFISVAGFGQYQPTADNETPENRALNRRTELVLVPNLKELQLASAPSPFWACKVAAVQVKKAKKSI